MKHLLAVLATAAGLAVPIAGGGSAEAATVCDKYASTHGDDSNPGTAAAPYRSLNKLIAGAGAGGVGCLKGGETYFAVQGNGVISNSGAAGAPVTITGETPGTVLQGKLWIRPTSHDITFQDLRFLGNYGPSGAPNGTKATHLIVHGDRVSFLDNEISDPRGICIGAGKADQLDASVNDVAEDLRVIGNDIHHCGMAPDITWATGDSGAHGIYLENTVGAVIADNQIHDNRYRGLQLWPRNNGAEIHHNLFARNATHVNIGSSLSCDGSCRVAAPQGVTGTFKAENTDVHDNIFVERVTTWRQSQNPSQVYGFFPAKSPTYGNAVHHNCFAPNDPAATGDGFAQYDNSVVLPTFADGRLTADSSCVGRGPASIQPQGDQPEEPEEPQDPAGPAIDATVSGPNGVVRGLGVVNTTGADQTVAVSRAAGRTVSFRVRIHNPGPGADDWWIADAIKNTRGFRATWLLAGENVTQLVRGGNLSQAGVEGGETVELTLVVKVTRTAAGTATWWLHGIEAPVSAGVRDVVGIKVTRR